MHHIDVKTRIPMPDPAKAQRHEKGAKRRARSLVIGLLPQPLSPAVSGPGASTSALYYSHLNAVDRADAMPACRWGGAVCRARVVRCYAKLPKWDEQFE